MSDEIDKKGNWWYLWTRDGVKAPTQTLDKDPVPAQRCILTCRRCNEIFAFEETLDAHQRAFCKTIRKGWVTCHYDANCGYISHFHAKDHVQKYHQNAQHIIWQSPILRPEFQEQATLLDSMTEVTDLPITPRPRFGFVSFMHPQLPVPLLIYEYLDFRNVKPTERRPTTNNWILDRMLPSNLSNYPPTSILPPGYEWGHGASWSNHAHESLQKEDCRLSSNAIAQHSIANQFGIAEIESLSTRIAKRYPVRVLTGVLLHPSNSSAIGQWITKLILYQDPATQEYFYDAWKLPNTDAATSAHLKFRWSLEDYNAATGWNLLNKIIPTRKNLMQDFPPTTKGRKKQNADSDSRFSLPENMPTSDSVKIQQLETSNSELRAEKEVLAHELATLIVDMIKQD